MTNSEFRISKEARTTKSELTLLGYWLLAMGYRLLGENGANSLQLLSHSCRSYGVLPGVPHVGYYSFVIRHSSFGFS